jgi:hypothetical protein
VDLNLLQELHQRLPLDNDTDYSRELRALLDATSRAHTRPRPQRQLPAADL